MTIRSNTFYFFKAFFKLAKVFFSIFCNNRINFICILHTFCKLIFIFINDAILSKIYIAWCNWCSVYKMTETVGSR